MPSVSMLFPLTLCWAFTAVVGQTTISTADPSEYPYVVKLQLNDLPYATTFPGMVVSKRYILTSADAYRNGYNYANITMTDQSGTVYPAIRSGRVDYFAYWKTCQKFTGPKYSLAASSFANITDTITDAEFILYLDESYGLQKVAPVTVLSITDCTNLYPLYADQVLCIDINTTPEYCSFFSDDFSGEAFPTYIRYPALAIGGQVYAVFAQNSEVENAGCNNSSVNDVVGTIRSIAYSRQSLLWLTQQ